MTTTRPAISRRNRSAHLGVLVLIAAAALLPALLPAESSSASYRLIGSNAASIAGRTESASARLDGAGGNGLPHGIAASPNASMVSGNASTSLPTERLLTSGFE